MIIKLCELQDDLKQLTGNDLTEVGERGINLSGGQKQRIAIARAIYQDSDIYVIDDCLSALDIHVGKQIFYNVFKNYLKGKTIILVTHALQFLQEVDRIIIMKNGEIIINGSYSEIINNPESGDFLSKMQQQTNEKPQNINEDKTAEIENTKQLQEAELIKKGKLIKNEESAVGAIPGKYDGLYLKSAGYFTFFNLVFWMLATPISQSIANGWLGIGSRNGYNLTSYQYIGIFFAMSIIVIIFFFIRTIVTAKFTITAAKVLQIKLTNSILHCPLGWFDVTPTSRILNRTGKDQDNIDNMLPLTVEFMLSHVSQLIVNLVVGGIGVPIVFAIITIVFFGFL